MAFAVIWDLDLLISDDHTKSGKKGSKSKNSVNQGSESDHPENQGPNLTIRKTWVRI